MSYHYQYGNGTSWSPFQVWNAEDLNGVRYHMDAYFIQMDHINLQNWNWLPIGSQDWTEGITNWGYHWEGFTGAYDGNFKKILNLTISYFNIYRRNINGVGLFSCIRGGSFPKEYNIRNLILENVNFKFSALDSNSRVGVSDMGGLVGYMDYDTTIESCSVQGVIEVIADDTNYVGLIGMFVGSSYGNIRTSMAKGKISMSGEYMYPSEIGGFSAWVFDGKVKNCYAQVDVQGNAWVAGFTSEIGQHACNGEVINCYSTGKVEIIPSGIYADPENEAVSVAGFAAICSAGHKPLLVQNCFYDAETSQKPSVTFGDTPKKFAPDIHYGIPKTTLQMKDINTYLENDTICQSSSRCPIPACVPRPWDFDNVWGIHPMINGGYPFLKWERISGFSNIYTKINGIWRSIIQVWVKIQGEWKEVDMEDWVDPPSP